MMDRDKKSRIHLYTLKFAGWGGVLFILAAGAVGIFWSENIGHFCFAYLICFLLVGSNFWLMHKIGMPEFNHFLRMFIISFATRFIGTTVAITAYIWLVQSGQFFFTISFIISYICLSVIEITFIYKILGFYKTK